MWNATLNKHLDHPIAEAADAITVADIYDYARQYLRMSRDSAHAYADWLDATLNEWGPDHATTREVLNSAHRTWNSL